MISVSHHKKVAAFVFFWQKNTVVGTIRGYYTERATFTTDSLLNNTSVKIPNWTHAAVILANIFECSEVKLSFKKLGVAWLRCACLKEKVAQRLTQGLIT